MELYLFICIYNTKFQQYHDKLSERLYYQILNNNSYCSVIYSRLYIISTIKLQY